MAQNYFVETTAEADRVVRRLVAAGYPASSRDAPPGHLIIVDAGPSVVIEELLLESSETVRRV